MQEKDSYILLKVKRLQLFKLILNDVFFYTSTMCELFHEGNYAWTDNRLCLRAHFSFYMTLLAILYVLLLTKYRNKLRNFQKGGSVVQTGYEVATIVEIFICYYTVIPVENACI